MHEHIETNTKWPRRFADGILLIALNKDMFDSNEVSKLAMENKRMSQHCLGNGFVTSS